MEKLTYILKSVDNPTERISLRFLMPISIEKKKKMAIEAWKWRRKGGQHQRGFHTHTINFRKLEVVFRENYCHCWIKHTLLGISSVRCCDWIWFESNRSIRIRKLLYFRYVKITHLWSSISSILRIQFWHHSVWLYFEWLMKSYLNIYLWSILI